MTSMKRLPGEGVWIERPELPKTRSSGAGAKTTILEGYYATGDYEAFCFDQCRGPSDHYEHGSHEDSCRSYPDSMLPVEMGSYGRWTVTISFEPLPEPPDILARTGSDDE